MKTILLILALCVAVPMQSGCQQAPSARVVQVQTLLAVGQSAEGAVALSAQLYRDNKITATQARQVMDVYNLKFQPAYRAAVTAARSDLSSLASPDVLLLAAELSALVLQFYPAKP